jgi:antitoxin VapB
VEVEMERVAKLFKNGRNQAVRLPVEFQFDTDCVYIRREENGDVVLSTRPAKPDNWEVLLNMLRNNPVPDDFLDAEDRQQGVADRDPFAEGK